MMCRTILTIVVLSTVVACDGSTAPTLAWERVDTAWVTASVATRLDAFGRFSYAHHPAEGTRAEVSASKSNDLAEGWRRTFASFEEEHLSAQRGAVVTAAGLHLCEDRALYAHRAYQEVDTTVVRPAARAVGPFWFHVFCTGDNGPSVALASSAYNTDVEIRDGKLRLAEIQGNEFQSSGIPIGFFRRPISPERAVALVFHATGVRVGAVPELHMPPRPLPAYEARWLVRLEEAVRVVRGPADTVITDELWIGTSSSAVEADFAIAGDPLTPVTFTYTYRDQNGQLVSREFTALPEPNRAFWVRVLPI